MKKPLILAFLVLLLGFSACRIDNPDDGRALEEALQQRQDTVQLWVDSLMALKMSVPQLYDTTFVDPNVVGTFDALARRTGGETKVLMKTGLLVETISTLIQRHAVPLADLLLLIDKTGSMDDDIELIKAGLDQLMQTMGQFQGLHVGVALYGDKNVDGKDWFSFQDFQSDLPSARKFIQNITVTGGGDYPESAFEGFFAANERGFWRSKSKRMVILIGDAPPLEPPMGEHTLDDVVEAARQGEVNMNFYPIVVAADPYLEEYGAKIYQEADLVSELFPNPATDKITVRCPEQQHYTAQCISLAGAIVWELEFTGAEQTFPLDGLDDGLYVLRLIADDGKFDQGKFVVRH